MAPGELNSTGERRQIEQHRLQRLKDDVWLFVRENWKTVLAGILGFVIGYWKLRSDIGGAITAAQTARAAAGQTAIEVAELHLELAQLATKQALDLTNKRIDDWNIWYAGAHQIAGESPQPRRGSIPARPAPAPAKAPPRTR